MSQDSESCITKTRDYLLLEMAAMAGGANKLVQKTQKDPKQSLAATGNRGIMNSEKVLS